MIERDFDYSMMKSFLNCERRFYYRYILSVVPDPKVIQIIPGAMEFGSAIDKGLDVAYSMLALNKEQQEKLFKECFADADYKPGRFQVVAAMAARREFEEQWGDVKNKGYSKELGVDLLDEYCSVYFPEKFDIIDSQVSGPLPIFHPNWRNEELHLMFKADAIVWGYDPNKYSVFETKTTSNPNDAWWYGQLMSMQTDGYVMGAESYYGKTIHSAILNVIGTKMAKGKKRLDRRPIIMSTLRREIYRRWLLNTVDRIMELQHRTINKYGHFGTDIASCCMNATKQGGTPHEIWLENRSNCNDYWRQCNYTGLCDSDCHMGAFSSFVENTWRPYMRHEEAE